jgi:hypothetical protein
VRINDGLSADILVPHLHIKYDCEEREQAMIVKQVERKFISAPRDEASFWRTKSPQERLAALEDLRTEYHQWKYGNAESGFQRVYRRVERP